MSAGPPIPSPPQRRLDCVELFSRSPLLAAEVQSKLRSCADLERLVQKVTLLAVCLLQLTRVNNTVQSGCHESCPSHIYTVPVGSEPSDCAIHCTIRVHNLITVTLGGHELSVSLRFNGS